MTAIEPRLLASPGKRFVKLRNGQPNGARSLSVLRKLLAVSSSEQLPELAELPGPPVRKDPATAYIEAEIIEPARSADIPPPIEEAVIQLPYTYALTRAVTAPESYECKQWKREQVETHLHLTCRGLLICSISDGPCLRRSSGQPARYNCQPGPRPFIIGYARAGAILRRRTTGASMMKSEGDKSYEYQ